MCSTSVVFDRHQNFGLNANMQEYIIIYDKIVFPSKQEYSYVFNYLVKVTAGGQ